MPETLRSIAVLATIAVLAASLVYLSGCSIKSKRDPFAGIGSPMYKGEGPLPKGGGRYEVGIPYEVAGLWFYPKEDPSYDKNGVRLLVRQAIPPPHDVERRVVRHGLSVGRAHDLAACRAMPRSPISPTAANSSFASTTADPLSTTGSSISPAKSADALGFRKKGTTAVRVQYIGPAPLNDQGSHLAAMNRELARGTPLDRMIAAAAGGRDHGDTELSLAMAVAAAEAYLRPRRSKSPTGNISFRWAPSPISAMPNGLEPTCLSWAKSRSPR